VDTVPFRTNLRLPRVNEALCIGCGACEYACPVRPQRAITVAARARHIRAQRAVEAKPAVRPAAGDFAF
jgi:ferredoxin